MPNPTSLEAWAERCFQEHYGRHLIGDLTAPMLCINCARAYAAQVRQEEREACAKLIEEGRDAAGDTICTHEDYCEHDRIAAAIRGREA